MQRAMRGTSRRTRQAVAVSTATAKEFWTCIARFSVPPVGVLEAHDVVLAEIGARLHLDEMERDLAGILQPVADAERNIGRLVLVEQDLLAAPHHLGGARDDDPVLGAVMVH